MKSALNKSVLNRRMRLLSWPGALFQTMLLAAAVLCVISGAWSQTASTGALRGTILDPSGAAIPNANVQVTNQDTGARNEIKSGPNGGYSLPVLPPGMYRIEVAATGFARAKHADITVAVTETTVMNVTMQVGASDVTVEVHDTPAITETTTAALGDVVATKQVESLPLVSRNYTQILDLSAGVTAGVTRADEIGQGSGGETPVTEGGGLNVHGARANDNNFQMNGVDVNDFSGGGSLSGGIPIPNPDTIQEFKVQTGMYDAQYGRNAGANVDVVTRTGSNAVHGSLFEFWRNDVLNANDYFFNENGASRPELKQNQFGGTIGGPIKKNKLLFFASYQGTEQVNGVQGRQTFYSPLTTDDRSAAAIGTLFAGQRGYFQNLFGGVGPAVAADGSNINPVALALLQMKLPNGKYLFPTANENAQVSLSVPARFSEKQYMGNFDYIVSSKHSIQGRYFGSTSNTTNSFPAGSGNLAGYPVVQDNRYNVTSVTDSYVISPTLINQARLGYMRKATSATAQAPFSWSQVDVTSSSQNDALPSLLIEGSDSLGSDEEHTGVQNLFDLEDSFNWTRGRHSFRFGGGVIRAQLNNFTVLYGLVGFASWPDFLLGLNGADNGTGIFSNVLYSVDMLGNMHTAERNWQTSLYFQDDFRVSSRLTLNLGVRQEWLPPATLLHGRATAFNISLVDPNPPAEGSLAGYVVPANWTYPVPAGVTKSSVDSFVPGSGSDAWGPRIGFAYSLLPHSDRLVLHGGYGIYYSAISVGEESESVPSLPWAALRISTPPYNGGASWADPFPEPIPPLSSFPYFAAYTPSSDVQSVATEQNLRPGITQQYTLNLQYALSPNLVLQLAYVGSKSDHLVFERSVNQAGFASASNPIRGETTNTVENIPLRVPYEGFDPGAFYQVESEGRSNYNGLEVTLKKNFSKGLQFLAAYTFSRTLGTGASSIVASTTGSGSLGDQNNLYVDYGPASFDRTQRLIVSATYEFPNFKHGPRFGTTMLSGWALTGVGTFQSGQPLTFTNQNSSNVFGTTNDFAFINLGASGCNGIGRSGSVTSRLGEYFNTSCFANPPAIGDGTGFGTPNVGLLRGPGQHNVDLSLSKISALTERLKLEFRAEFFNVFNTAQFANPDTAFSDGPAFGMITSTSVAPRIGQLALKLNF